MNQPLRSFIVADSNGNIFSCSQLTPEGAGDHLEYLTDNLPHNEGLDVYVLVKASDFLKAKNEGSEAIAEILIDKGKDLLNGNGANEWECISLALAAESHEMILGRKFNVIVPATSLVDANKTVDLDEDTVFIGPSKTGNRFICQCGHRVLVTQLIPGSFPDFEQIIPKNKTTSVTINSNSFIKALKQAHIFSRDSMNNIVRLVFQNESTEDPADQRLTIVGQSEETGDVSSEIPETQIEGKSLTIAFNANFLLDVMSAVKTDFVLFEGKEPVDPGMFKAVGDDEFLHIIMPMRIEEIAAPIADGDAQEETNE